jgi:hypothetical protein
MATLTWKPFWNSMVYFHTKKVSWTADTIKLAICSSALTVDAANNTLWSGISSTEVGGTGYTAGGSQLAGCTCTVSGSVMALKATDLTTGSCTFTNGSVCIIYESTGGSLLFYGKSDGPISPNNAPVTVTFNASGIYTITAPAA